MQPSIVRRIEQVETILYTIIALVVL